MKITWRHPAFWWDHAVRIFSTKHYLFIIFLLIFTSLTYLRDIALKEGTTQEWNELGDWDAQSVANDKSNSLASWTNFTAGKGGVEADGSRGCILMVDDRTPTWRKESDAEWELEELLKMAKEGGAEKIAREKPYWRTSRLINW